MTEQAQFRKADIDAVYPSLASRRCFLLGSHSELNDLHHILSRGYAFGYNKKNEGRAMFSSVLNASWINRGIHSGPFRDAEEFRYFFLRKSLENVMVAVAEERYVLNDKDLLFIDFLVDWFAEHPIVSPLASWPFLLE